MPWYLEAAYRTVADNLVTLAVILAALVLAALACLGVVMARQSFILRMLRPAGSRPRGLGPRPGRPKHAAGGGRTPEAAPKDLVSLVLSQAQALEALTAGLDSARSQEEELSRRLRSVVQKVGLVRFNAFADTGSDLSFAAALLDGDNSGLVISSLFGRDESRIYAKPVVAGQSSYPLSAEEKEAIRRAIAGEQLPGRHEAKGGRRRR